MSDVKISEQLYDCIADYFLRGDRTKINFIEKELYLKETQLGARWAYGQYLRAKTAEEQKHYWDIYVYNKQYINNNK